MPQNQQQIDVNQLNQAKANVTLTQSLLNQAIEKLIIIRHFIPLVVNKDSFIFFGLFSLTLLVRQTNQPAPFM